MKKHLLAVAVAAAVAAPAFAQNVSISGRIGAVVNQEKYTGIGKNQRTVEDPNSRVIFTVTEDLGQGLKFTGQIDMRATIDATASTTENSSGNSFGAISGGFGRVLMGRHDMHYNEVFDLGAGYVNDASSTYRNILMYVPTSTTATTSVGIGRVQNLVRYDSPAFAGFSATVGYSQNAAADEVAQTANNAAQGGATIGTLRYSQGPISAYVSNFRRKDDNQAIQLVSQIYGAKYNVGNGIEVAANFGTASSQSGVGTKYEKNAFTIPVSYTVGANTFVLTVGETEAASNLANSGASLTDLTWNYALSKRTTLSAAYTSLSNESGVAYGLYGSTASNAVAGADGTNFSIGIRHNF